MIASFSYSYQNGSGADTDLRQSVTYQYPGDSSASTISYGYDGLERLTGANGGGHSYAYSYGPNGNMTAKTIDGTTTNYNYNGASEVVASGYSYDANGSETSMLGETLTYNALDQTSKIVVGSATVNQTYTGLGQAGRVTSGGTTFLNDQLGINQTSSTAATTSYTRDTDGTVLGERNPGNGSGNYNYYFLFDGLGSIIAVTDSAGNIANTYHYDPYGNITATTGNVVDPFRSAGGYYGSTIKALQVRPALLRPQPRPVDTTRPCRRPPRPPRMEPIQIHRRRSRQRQRPLGYVQSVPMDHRPTVMRGAA